MQQFAVLAEELNFRKAAVRLHMTQPPLSAAIRRLEADMGVVLFERSRTRVELTSAGSAFLREVRRLLGQVELAVDVARAAEQGPAGVLRIASVESAALAFLPALLGKFRVAYPDIRLVLSTDSSHNEITALRNGMIDVAVIVPSATEMNGIQVSVVKQERFCLAVSSEHRLAARKTARLSAIAEDPLVALYPFASSPGYSAAILEAFQRAKVYPRVHQAESQIFSNLVLVAAGVGVAVMPEPMRNIHVPNVTFLKLVSDRGKALVYPIALACRANSTNTAAASLIDLALRMK